MARSRKSIPLLHPKTQSKDSAHSRRFSGGSGHGYKRVAPKIVMVAPEFAVIRNLNDAGCDAQTKATFLELHSGGRTEEEVRLLQRHRKMLLAEIHKNQKKSTALTFFCSDCNKQWKYQVILRFGNKKFSYRKAKHLA